MYMTPAKEWAFYTAKHQGAILFQMEARPLRLHHHTAIMQNYTEHNINYNHTVGFQNVWTKQNNVTIHDKN